MGGLRLAATAMPNTRLLEARLGAAVHKARIVNCEREQDVGIGQSCCALCDNTGFSAGCTPEWPGACKKQYRTTMHIQEIMSSPLRCRSWCLGADLMTSHGNWERHLLTHIPKTTIRQQSNARLHVNNGVRLTVSDATRLTGSADARFTLSVGAPLTVSDAVR